METTKCFEPGCMLEVECSCQCTSPEILSCKLHIAKHIKLLDKTHIFTSIFVEPCQETKESILAFLTQKMSKNDKIKKKILSSFNKQVLNSKTDLKELIKNLNLSSEKIANCYTKIFQAKKLLKSELDPVLGLLKLQPEEAIEKIKLIVEDNPDWYDSSKAFFGFNKKIEKMIECFIKDKFENYLDTRLAKLESNLEEHDKNIGLINIELSNVKDSISKLINKNNENQKILEDWKAEIKIKLENETSLINSQVTCILEDHKNKDIFLSLRDKSAEILNRPIDLDLEKEFRKTCTLYKKNQNIYDSLTSQAYHDYASIYHHKTSIYNLVKKDKTNLVIYDTESEHKEIQILETPEPLSGSACICQLPNGKLFCYGTYPASGITLIIDGNCGIQELPSGIPCSHSSAIYFKKNIYCFGGGDINNKPINLSRRFDLDINQWIELAPMPKDAGSGNSIIFNENILISWWAHRNLLRYSIDNNSFTTIDFEFAEKKRKFLINAERLYLIECKNGSIYESEIESDNAWRIITDSSIVMDPVQVYGSYNKEAIYIGCVDVDGKIGHFKFDLNLKRISLFA